MIGVDRYCLLILHHPVCWFEGLCVKHPPSGYGQIQTTSQFVMMYVMMRPFGSVGILPLPPMRCLHMHRNTVDNPNSTGHVPLVLGPLEMKHID